jgi:glycosyltransferase involved in cell wall biosynthesis
MLDFKKKVKGAYDFLHTYVQRDSRKQSSGKTGGHRRRSSPGMTKVLHVIDSLVPEGAEQLLIDILSKSDRTNHEYVVCCLASRGPIADEIEDLGIPVCVIGRTRKIDVRCYRRLKALIREFDPDIVHTHLFTSSFWGRIAAFRMGKMCVVTEHNTSDWKRWYHRVANRWLARITSKVIAVSDGVKSSLVQNDRIHPDRITVIQNGLSLDRMKANGSGSVLRREFKCDDDDILAVTVASLTEQKGHRYLIEAAQQFVRNRPNLKVACVGDGPLRKELEARVQARHLGDNVTFTGVRRDIRDILDAADVFILPSLYEGLSISLLEAAAMAKPIITTSIGTSEEIIQDGETGLMVKPCEASEIARALEYCADNRAQAIAMGKRASRLVRSNFSVEKTAREYEELYRDLLGY